MRNSIFCPLSLSVMFIVSGIDNNNYRVLQNNSIDADEVSMGNEMILFLLY